VYVIIGGALIRTSAPSVTINQTTGVITTTGGSGGGLLASLFFSALSGFIGLAILAVVQSNIIHGALEIANGRKVEIGDFFRFQKIGNVIVAAIIVAVAYGVGLFLCIIPGLLVLFFSQFYLFFIMDQDMAPWDSIMASFRLISSNIGSMIVLIIGVIVAYIIGIILCFVGLIVTLPVALLALTFAYRKFQNQPVAA